MTKEQIKLVKSWFKKEHSYGTYYTVNEFYVCAKDMKVFFGFLNTVFKDLEKLECEITLDGIHFSKNDLEYASFYERI